MSQHTIHYQMQSLNEYTKLLWSALLTWKIIMKIQKIMNIVNLITSFNQLHGYHVIRSVYHTTLQATPCQLVFGRDMIHNIAFRTNWDWIKNKAGDKKEKRKLSISQIKKKTRTILKFLINIRLETKSVVRITRNSPKKLSFLYRTISYNKCVQEWYKKNPKKIFIRKSEYP
jgi:hypothetical protein